MREKKSLPRWLKWLAGIVGGILLLAAGVALFLSAYWRPILEKEIKKSVRSSTDSLYSIEFKGLHMNLLSGNLSLDSIDFKPDTAVYRKQLEDRKAPGSLYYVKVNSLIFNRVAFLDAYFKKEIDIRNIIIDRPDVKVVKYKTAKDTSQKGKNLYQIISKSLKSVQIENIVLNDADLDYTNRSKGDPTTTLLQNLSVKVSDLRIDSASQHDKTRFYFAKDVFFQIKDYKAKTTDKMYTLRFDDLSGSVKSRLVKIKGVKLIPVYSEMEFSRKYKNQHDRYDLNFPEISFRDVDFAEYDRSERVLASSLEIRGGRVNVFLNRSLPPPPIDKKINFPHIALRRLPVETRINSLQIRNVDVNYTEYSPESSRKGTLTFRKLSGTISNVTNDNISLKRNNFAKAVLSAYLMGKGRLDVNINFNLTASNGAFTYRGWLGRFDLRNLGQLARNLAMLEIQSGVVNKANFSVSGNVNGSTGNLNLYYSDLKIKLLKKDEETLQLEKKGFMSFLANVAVIKNDNPEKDGDFRKGPITFQRPPSASFFNVLWKSVFIGVREAVGLGAIPMKDQPEMNEKMQKEAAKNKEREERKRKREERRKARKEN